MRSKGGSLSFSAGQAILSEGDPGKEMYVVEEGQVELFRRGATAAERRIGVLSSGDFFGEMSVIDDLPRGASARALTDCKLLAVDHATFDQMIRTYPEVAVRMLRKMSARIRELEGDLEALLPSSETVMRASERPEKAAPAEAPPLPPPVAPPPPPPAPPAAEAPAAAAPPAPTRWTIVLVDTGATIELPDKPDIRVGRYDSATKTAPDVDLTEADAHKTTSRRHAKLVREDGRVFVCEETATANGTYVNGKRIGTGVNVPLNDGDALQFGGVKAVLKAAS